MSGGISPADVKAQLTPLSTEGAQTIPRRNMQVGLFFGEGYSATAKAWESKSISYGLNVGYGITDQLDLKITWSGNNYAFKLGDEWTEWSLFRENTFRVSPKFSFLKGHMAAKLPVAVVMFTSEMSLSTQSVFLISPRVIGSLFYKQYLECWLSPYVDIYLPPDRVNTVCYGGVNLGLAVSTNLKKWSVRPEGYLATPLEILGKENVLIYGFGMTAVLNFEAFR